ncbi:hypothetical protein KIMC2_08590 [Xylocopilactobacillus apis]|uniref:GHMP kinase C-terminal domain-containing protein n=1 Tax=Xylocopilactobacillus apis TaxID=2932183 RepID=A0AAU9D6A3_9LACO|nr:hypothetical protein KIMC2_08590 [Xylocopilactobacillus apis]
MDNYFQTNLSFIELYHLANVSEKIVHTNPSGLDLITSGSDTPIIFQKNKKPVKFQINRNLEGYLVIATTPKNGITKNAVKKVSENAKMHPALYTEYFNSIEGITYRAIDHLQNGNLEKFGLDLSENQQILSKMQLSTAKIDDLIKLAHKNGSLGAKITGSGLGGSIFALMKDYESAVKLERIFCQEKANFTHIISLNEYCN